MAVNDWIAQYMADLFRREPRNVGIFVEADGEIVTRFLGTGESGGVDGRKLRGRVEYVDVYKQWVEFWTTEIRTASVPEVLALSGPHYRVVDGGVVDDAAPHELADVADYLFGLLVSETRIARDVFATEEDAPAAQLQSEVLDAFRAENIITTGTTVAEVPHPIRRSIVVVGSKNVEYRPAFTQENGRLYLMETIDFTTTKKKTARDHAGWTAYAFSDVSASRPSEPIAIVKVTEQDLAEAEDVRNGMRVLQNEARVVNWLEPTERQAFIEERKAVAYDTTH